MGIEPKGRKLVQTKQRIENLHQKKKKKKKAAQTMILAEAEPHRLHGYRGAEVVLGAAGPGLPGLQVPTVTEASS